MALIATRPSLTAISPPPLSLTAAASVRKVRPGDMWTVSQEGWQSRMWHYYRHLGAVHYGINFKKNAASKVTYFAAEKTDWDPEPTTNQVVIDAVDRLRSRFGGIKEIVAELMVHLNVPGEGYLVGQDGLEGEDWDVWSVAEVRRAQGFANLMPKPDQAELEGDTLTIRIWRPDPEDRTLADSPLRPVSEQCDQLLLLEDSISAAAKSRLSAGLLMIPSELDIGPLDTFQDELIAVLTTPIRETDSAARWAPGVLRGPAEILSKVQLLHFDRQIDATFANMRDELTSTIATGLDLPAEIILGKSDLNHWTSWEIDESAFRDHIDPDIILILDSITRGYLVPALKEAGVANADDYLIWRDLSDLGQRPPTIPEATELFDRGLISGDYMRGLINATDEDMPEPEDQMLPDPAAPPVEAVGVGIPRGEPALVAAEPRHIPLTGLARIDETLFEKVSEATEAAFGRVLERAGAKIRSHARKDRAISMSIDRIPNEAVTRHLGEKLVAQLQITPGELVPGDSFDPLIRRLRSIFAGVTEAVADELEQLTGVRAVFDAPRIQGAIGTYITELEGFALQLLFNPIDPGPGEVGDAQVPAGMVLDMMTTAGGGTPTPGPSNARGFATGQASIEFLTQHGITLAGHLWDYGSPATRRRPFEPHHRLDGTEFTDWTDDRLITPASASFLNVGHMFPGDHYRCQCRTVPVMVERAA